MFVSQPVLINFFFHVPHCIYFGGGIRRVLVGGSACCLALCTPLYRRVRQITTCLEKYFRGQSTTESGPCSRAFAPGPKNGVPETIDLARALPQPARRWLVGLSPHRAFRDYPKMFFTASASEPCASPSSIMRSLPSIDSALATCPSRLVKHSNSTRLRSG